MQNIKGLTSKEAVAIVKGIGLAVRIGQLDYESGKKEAAEYLELINSRMAVINKKYKVRRAKMSWQDALR